jgi:hypothetical protein
MCFVVGSIDSLTLLSAHLKILFISVCNMGPCAIFSELITKRVG